jgi:CMP-N-acetylneuraminic acid synthetase
MRAWALVPARGGSKSIPRKNLVPLAGRPVLDYGVSAAVASGCFDRIFCSTDDAGIAARARVLGIETVERPPHLAGDSAKVDEVGREFLAAFDEAAQPDCVVLIQPTSPFLLPGHIRDLLAALEAHPQAASIHNATPIPHNLHAWNHRQIGPDGMVSFLFAEQRKGARNKQEKPKLYSFGNLIAARSAALRAGRGFYAEPVCATELPAPWNFDLDTLQDVAAAEALLQSGQVVLPHFLQSQVRT